MGGFDHILGNGKLKKYITTAVRLGRISHSYIIEGEKGSGKKLLSLSFSKMIQCQSENDRPCGLCQSCIQIDHHNHPDLIYIRHEKANTISVDEIRMQIVNTAEIKPYKGPYKIYIVDEAEKMGQAAQNALLKTLEEPPEYVIIFLLVSNKESLLETIRSRSVHLSVEPVKKEEIYHHLIKEGYSSKEADFAAGYAFGNVGKALSVLSSEEFIAMRDMVFQILRKIEDYHAEDISEIARSMKEYKNRIGDILDLFLIWYRDVLVLKTGRQKDRIIFRDEYDHIDIQSQGLSMKSIGRIFSWISDTEKKMRANVNYEAVIMMLLMNIHKSFENG